MPTAPERHLIKKYANRKLYDTRTSSYVTLEDLAALVREGHEIKVVDRETGKDLTQLTLSQIGDARVAVECTDACRQIGERHPLGRGDLEGIVDEAIERALRRLRIPSHTDIDKINKRLDQLSAQLKGTSGHAPSKAKTPRRGR